MVPGRHPQHNPGDVVEEHVSPGRNSRLVPEPNASPRGEKMAYCSMHVSGSGLAGSATRNLTRVVAFVGMPMMPSSVPCCRGYASHLAVHTQEYMHDLKTAVADLISIGPMLSCFGTHETCEVYFSSLRCM